MASTGIRETGARLMPRTANAPILNFIELQDRHTRISTKAGNTLEIIRSTHEFFQTGNTCWQLPVSSRVLYGAGVKRFARRDF